ncbi:MAG: beta galactosidase jelly roll domain-containing protein, partial [Treponema sp.]|nr:beta galactosidase jelly roll domain-containing protein [Treponema sp.]
MPQKNPGAEKKFSSRSGAAHFAKVYLNGKFLGDHRCGYTSFTFDLTENLLPEGQTNVLDIIVDSREDTDEMKDIPPFGNRIDYMTYGGIYREVYIEVKNPVYIEDVFVTTKKNKFSSSIKISGDFEGKGFTIRQTVVPSLNAPVPVGADKNAPCFEINTGVPGNTVLTSALASG